MIIWIIGLSGSGKTTLGNELMNQLSNNNDKWMLMDGDRFRTILGEDLGHDIESRKKVGQRLVNLSEEFDRQEHNLIVCVLSLFPEHQAANRKYIKEYKEIFLDVSLETLRNRDNKGLYKMADDGQMDNVVGLDIPFPEPQFADFIIDNNKDKISFEKTAKKLIKDMNLQEESYRYPRKNLFSYKEKYEYTSFEGKEYISSYLNIRAELISNLNTKVKTLNSFYPIENKENFLFQGKIPVSQYFIERELTYKEANLEGRVETKVILLNWLKFFEEGRIDEKIFLQILTLLQRFEVSKRLYETYTIEGIKKGGEIIECLDVYLLFGLLLVKSLFATASLERKVIFFNTILKVCDLISSVPERLSTPCEIALAKELFEQEQNIYNYINEVLK